MSNPTDLRVIKTRQAIRIALISLLSEKELSDITISELSARAQVNRKTFYYHFEDIFSLLKWTLDQEAMCMFGKYDLVSQRRRSRGRSWYGTRYRRPRRKPSASHTAGHTRSPAERRAPALEAPAPRTALPPQSATKARRCSRCAPVPPAFPAR